jgi:hypothetical protein
MQCFLSFEIKSHVGKTFCQRRLNVATGMFSLARSDEYPTLNVSPLCHGITAQTGDREMPPRYGVWRRPITAQRGNGATPLHMSARNNADTGAVRFLFLAAFFFAWPSRLAAHL